MANKINLRSYSLFIYRNFHMRIQRSVIHRRWIAGTEAARVARILDDFGLLPCTGRFREVSISSFIVQTTRATVKRNVQLWKNGRDQTE